MSNTKKIYVFLAATRKLLIVFCFALSITLEPRYNHILDIFVLHTIHYHIFVNTLTIAPSNF